MDHNVNVVNGNNYSLISILLGITTFLTPDNVELVIKIIVALGSVGTAIAAVRYYTLARRKIKAELEAMKKTHKTIHTRHK